MLNPDHLLHIPQEIIRYKGHSNKYDDRIAAKPFYLNWENQICFTPSADFSIEDHDFEASLGLREVRIPTEINHSWFGQMFDSSHCAQYYGEWLANTQVRQGRGILVNPIGDRYEGYFVKDKFEGKGHMAYSKTKEQKKKDYEGTWKAGLRHGTGTMIWKSGAKYKGDWLDGVRTGNGEYWWKDGGFYTG